MKELMPHREVMEQRLWTVLEGNKIENYKPHQVVSAACVLWPLTSNDPRWSKSIVAKRLRASLVQLLSEVYSPDGIMPWWIPEVKRLRHIWAPNLVEYLDSKAATGFSLDLMGMVDDALRNFFTDVPEIAARLIIETGYDYAFKDLLNKLPKETVFIKDLKSRLAELDRTLAVDDTRRAGLAVALAWLGSPEPLIELLQHCHDDSLRSMSLMFARGFLTGNEATVDLADMARRTHDSAARYQGLIQLLTFAESDSYAQNCGPSTKTIPIPECTARPKEHLRRGFFRRVPPIWFAGYPVRHEGRGDLGCGMSIRSTTRC